MTTASAKQRLRCSRCNFAPRFSSELLRHFRVHSGEKPFRCRCCPKTFRQSSHLNSHLLIHLKLKPFKCEYCKTRFRHRWSLTRHVRSRHTHDKPFQCSTCPAVSFITSTQLQQHEKIHSKTHSVFFMCGQCGHLLSSSRALWKHEKYHEISKNYQYACQFVSFGLQKATEKHDLLCGSKFKHLRGLLYHEQACHTVHGLRNRLKSEARMCRFFKEQNVLFTQDRANFISHQTCELNPTFEGSHSFPDFHLYGFTNIVLLVGNDEFEHRSQPCDLHRTLKIISAVSACQNMQQVPLVYIRFNPHRYEKAGISFDPPLEERYKTLADVLSRLHQNIINLNLAGLSLIYLYYSTDGNDTLKIFSDPGLENEEFAMALEPCLVEVIN